VIGRMATPVSVVPLTLLRSLRISPARLDGSIVQRRDALERRLTVC
jgi:hypothetical protein